MAWKNVVIIALPLLVACGGNDTMKAHSDQIDPAFPELSFALPLDLEFPDDGTNRLFVVEQPGAIRVFQNDSMTTSSKQFLDIHDRVNDKGWEEGLLGLAFHPDYRNNGYFYVNYTASDPRRTVISRFHVSADDPDEADPNSEQVILTFDQPFSNHNGGCLKFGPDGYLYIGVGDGGSEGDPGGNGQNLSTLLGKILRIDVDHPAGGRDYGIPPDNPFAANNSGYREEIYAYGLRNPWRFSFDPATGWLWAGDVGQDKYEEVDIIEKGKNYGWNIMEGNHCFSPPDSCDETGLTLPIWEYDHNDGRSITGGVVYHGKIVADLVGSYIFADFMNGRVWSMHYEEGKPASVTKLFDSELSISSINIDQNGELYFCAFDGNIYRLAPR